MDASPSTPGTDESGHAASALLFSTRLDGSHLRRVSPDQMPPTGLAVLAPRQIAPVKNVAIFDVDGTLVDTTYLHAVCWWQVFRQHQRDVPMTTIHSAIGMGADQLIPHLLGPTEQPEADALDSGHATLWRVWWPHVRRTRGAQELLRACSGAGMSVVLASSAAQDELATMCSVIAADDVIDATTNSADVEASKPSPDLVRTALGKAHADPADAVFVGDSVWDAAAASDAGVRFVGLCCGSASAAALTDSGAVAVYKDPLDALEHLGDWTA